MLVYNRDLLACFAFVVLGFMLLDFVVLVLYLELVDLLYKQYQLILDALVIFLFIEPIPHHLMFMLMIL